MEQSSSPLFVNVEGLTKRKGINMNFIRRPSIDLYPGVRVDKNTSLEFKNENVHQTIENLVFHSEAKVKGEKFESTYDTTIHLEEGDILIFEKDGRGYIKPMEAFVSVSEAIEDLESIKDMR